MYVFIIIIIIKNKNKNVNGWNGTKWTKSWMEVRRTKVSDMTSKATVLQSTRELRTAMADGNAAL
jgi:hypothetical protein